MNAWNRPAALVSGAWNTPATCASSASREGSSASASISAGVMIRAPSRPPFSTSAGLLRPKSRSALAAPAASPRTKAIATGPSNIDATPSRPESATALRAKVFLNTLYSVPATRSEARNAASSGTVSPRYSVRTAASASASFVRISSTTATFSGLAMLGLPIGRQRKTGRRRYAKRPVEQGASSGGPTSGRVHYLERDRRSAADSVVRKHPSARVHPETVRVRRGRPSGRCAHPGPCSTTPRRP